MKCQVKWVNAQGQPTPDNNEAVMMAHFHEPIWGTPGSNNKIQSYGNIRESFPICAEHYAMVDASFRMPRGGWTFTPIAETQEPTKQRITAQVLNGATGEIKEVVANIAASDAQEAVNKLFSQARKDDYYYRFLSMDGVIAPTVQGAVSLTYENQTYWALEV